MAAGLVLSLAILMYPQNRGSHWQSVSGLTFSPDGRHLAIGVYSGRFRSLRERWYVSDLFHTAAIADVASLPDAAKQFELCSPMKRMSHRWNTAELARSSACGVD